MLAAAPMPCAARDKTIRVSVDLPLSGRRGERDPIAVSGSFAKFCGTLSLVPLKVGLLLSVPWCTFLPRQRAGAAPPAHDRGASGPGRFARRTRPGYSPVACQHYKRWRRRTRIP
jgi:hypothetical protein